jgi:hypothetical protein
MTTFEIIRRLETYDIDDALKIYLSLCEDEDTVEQIIAFLKNRQDGNLAVVEKNSGSDKLGLVGKTTVLATSAAAGSAIVSTTGVAATIFGSSGLASVLGGVFVATTPIGWILAGAAGATALGYGAMKLVASGGKNDATRERNREGAKSNETYNSRRKVSPNLFVKIAPVKEIIRIYAKLSAIDPNNKETYEMDVDDMFNDTSVKKINTTKTGFSEKLDPAIGTYLKAHDQDIKALSDFMFKAVKYNIMPESEKTKIMEQVMSCDLLVDQFNEFLNILKKETLCNLQVMIYKLAILADGKKTDEEQIWFNATLKAKHICTSDEDALRKYDSCPTENVNISNLLSAIEDFFGKDIRNTLVDEIASIFLADGVEKTEYIFLKDVCNQIGIGKHYIVEKYEKDHKFGLIFDKVKSYFV